jgi:hypothetical protein
MPNAEAMIVEKINNRMTNVGFMFCFLGLLVAKIVFF